MSADYYNQLAPYYKYMQQDWNASVTRQAAALNGVIREFFGSPAQSLLDAACGIGTQSLGLAELGYQITASDISLAAISLAQAEAARRGLQISFGVADMRQLCASYAQPFDLVLAYDNAIPHTQVIRGGRYYCVTLARLEVLLRAVGFCEVTVLRDRFYQPLLIGKKNL